ncbi:MAG: PAS domain-containing protein [Pirellulales bacterium]
MPLFPQTPCPRCRTSEEPETPFCPWCGRRIITDPNRDTSAAPASEQFFRKLVEHSGDGIGLYDAETRMLYLTPSVRRMSGFEIDELLGLRAIDFAHPDDLATCSAMWEQVLRDPTEIGRMVLRARRKDGTYCSLDLTVVNRIDDADVHTVVVNLRDVTDEVQKAAEQKSIQQRYDLVINASQEGIWEIDVASNQVIVSERYQELTGYGPAAGRQSVDFWLGIIHPDERRTVARGLHDHLHDRKPYDTTFRLLTAHRGYRWFRPRGQADWDAEGAPTRFAGSIADVTEQLETQKALELSEERHALMVSGVNDGIWDWDLINTGRQYHSPRWYEIVGYRAEEFPKNPEAYFELVHPDDRTRVQEALRRNFERGERYALEIRLKHQDGDYRWVLTRGETVRDGAGRPVRMVGSICDIHDRKETESRLLESELRIGRLSMHWPKGSSCKTEAGRSSCAMSAPLRFLGSRATNLSDARH